MTDVAARSGNGASVVSATSGHTAPALAPQPSSLSFSSPANVAGIASAAQHVLSLGELDVDRRLDFVAANRVVAVLEKAVERLHLLSLLDAAAPRPAGQDGGPAANGGAGGSGDAEDHEEDGHGELGKKNGTAAQSGAQRVLARFAVDTQASGATVREAILASTATTRPAAAFTSSETAKGGESALGAAAGVLRHTAAQVTAALAEASSDTRRGRPSVAELLEEQQQLETRYGELLRAAQRLGLGAIGAAPASSSFSTAAQQRQQQSRIADGEGVGGGSTTGAVAAAPATTAASVQLCFTHVHDPEWMAVQRELAAVSKRLREHNRRLCTQLRDNPNDDDNWRKVSNERTELTALLQQTIAELTQGYAESRRTDYTGSGVLDGSFRAADSSGVGGGGVRRTDSRSSLAFGATGGGGGGGYEASLSRRGSQQGEGLDNRSQSGASSQQQSQGLTKRFGSTIQMRRTVKAANKQPRIPLLSGYAHVARKILQEEAAQRWADDLVRKERELNQNVKQLKADLQTERAKREREVADRQERIHALRVQLRELKRDLKQRSDEAKAEAEAATEGQDRRAAEEEASIDSACARLQRGLAVEQRTNELFTQHLAKRASEMDALGADWQRKNPAGLKAAELRRMDAEQTQQQCTERLQVCEAEMERHRGLKTARDADREAQETAARAAEALRQAQYAAASRLQSAVRAMLTRHAVVKLRKKSGKKKRGSSSAAA